MPSPAVTRKVSSTTWKRHSAAPCCFARRTASRRPRLAVGLPTVITIERFGLEPYVNKPIEGLSHGTRQRVAIVASLLHDPEILIVDEPMVGLDPKSSRLVKDLLRQRTAAGGTVFMSTHTLEIAEAIGIRIPGRVPKPSLSRSCLAWLPKSVW